MERGIGGRGGRGGVVASTSEAKAVHGGPAPAGGSVPALRGRRRRTKAYLAGVEAAHSVELGVKMGPSRAKRDAVEALAVSLGYDFGKSDDGSMCEYDDIPAWLGPLAMEGGRLTARGRNRAHCVMRFLGEMLDGRTRSESLRAAGMSVAQLNAFRYACPDLERMYRAAKAAQRESIGEDVLESAYGLAVEGSETYDRDGNPTGVKKKSEKMLDRLLVVSGPEFRKGGEARQCGGGGDGGEGGGGVSLTFNFGGSAAKTVEMEVVDVG